MSHYKHLTIEERESLYQKRGQGKSLHAIVRELGRSSSTLSRELNRNKASHQPYIPSSAQRRYEKQKKNCGRRQILVNIENGDLIQKLVGEYEWSPQQIENRLKFEGCNLQISYATIYRALKNCLLDVQDIQDIQYIRKCDRISFHLRRKGKPLKKNGKTNKQGKFHIQYTISDCPLAANDRSELAHWESDTVAGKKAEPAFSRRSIVNLASS